MTMLEAKNIHKVYNSGRNPLEVLKGVDLKIDDAKFVAIVGPSGVGKSTLLHILGGLDFPTDGEVILDGENIHDLGDNALSQIRNKKIGFVFQFYHLLSEFTVMENVLMPALISRPSTSLGSGKDRKTQRHKLGEKTDGLLHKIGLGDRIMHLPNQLSGGEQQRVAIARALINEPEILFCDEPTGNLDSRTGEGVMSLIKKINLENKMTVVLVTHNMELTKMADEVFHLRDGMLIS